VALGIFPNLLFGTTDDAVVASLDACLSVESTSEADELGCDPDIFETADLGEPATAETAEG
jgi:hypothetical protein